MVQISGRLSSIKPSGVRELFDLAGRYPDVVNLTLGEPDAAGELLGAREGEVQGGAG